MRGADALIAALERGGIDTVFGMPGGANLPLYDALLDSSIRHVLMRHEAGAGHAAEGYARATGRVGVAFATSGPGATNLVTPICDAHMDSTPTLFVTGQVRTALRGTNAFQEADVIGITAPIVKHSIAVERPDDIAQAITDALHIARAGRPGPVLVDVPVDVAKAPARGRIHEPQLPGYRPCSKPNGRQLRLAARALAAARRPVLYAGGGVVHAGAAAELTALAHRTGAPVTTTLMALGAFPASDPQWLGMLGMHGTCAANWAMDEADLIVAVGARFDDRVTGDTAEFAPRAKIVHIDVDPAEIDKIVAAHVPIVGDARRALAGIAAAYDGDPARLDDWWERIDGWRADPAPRTDAEAALDALAGALPADAIVTTDVGQHQMWAANRLRFDRPRRWITSGGLGTMGFGLPAAIGAQVAEPAATVVCVTGEGSLLLNVQELATAAQERLPVKLVMLDNGSLGMVRQQQDMFWGGRRSQVDLGAGPDWPAVAAAFGVAGRDVDASGDVEAAVAATLAEPGPALLRVQIDPDADCLPMFAPGTAARAMIGVERPTAAASCSAPSSRMTSPLSIGLLDDVGGEVAVLLRAAQAVRVRDLLAERRPGLLGKAGEQRRVEQPGRDRHDADAALGEVARRRERHADDPALGRRVGDLADLPVVGGDRRGVDADPALALGVGLVAEHRRRGEAQHVERADQVDLDDGLERVGGVRPALTRRLLRPADAGAADGDPQAVRRPPPRRPPARSWSRRTGRTRPSSSAASASPRSALRSAIGDVRAAGSQSPSGGRSQSRRAARHQRSAPVDSHLATVAEEDLRAGALDPEELELDRLRQAAARDDVRLVVVAGDERCDGEEQLVDDACRGERAVRSLGRPRRAAPGPLAPAGRRASRSARRPARPRPGLARPAPRQPRPRCRRGPAARAPGKARRSTGCRSWRE